MYKSYYDELLKNIDQPILDYTISADDRIIKIRYLFSTINIEYSKENEIKLLKELEKQIELICKAKIISPTDIFINLTSLLGTSFLIPNSVELNLIGFTSALLFITSINNIIKKSLINSKLIIYKNNHLSGKKIKLNKNHIVINAHNIECFDNKSIQLIETKIKEQVEIPDIDNNKVFEKLKFKGYINDY